MGLRDRRSMQVTASSFATALPEGSEVARLLHCLDPAIDAELRSTALRTTLSICLHSTLPMVLVWGPDQRCLYNDACIPLLGTEHPDALGRPLSTIEAPELLALRAEAANTGFPGKYRLEPGQSTPHRALTWNCSPVAGDNGQANGMLCIATGAQIQAPPTWEARDSFLLALEDTLQNLSSSQQIIDTSVRQLCDCLRADRCSYALVDDQEGSMRVTGDYSREMPGMRGDFDLQQLSETLREALQHNRPWVVCDYTSPGSPEQRWLPHDHFGAQASLVVPLHKNGCLASTISVHQSMPRQWLSSEIELVRMVAVRCWESLQRTQLQQQLAASEARVRQLAEALPQIIFIASQDGQLKYFNRRWYEYTGLDPAIAAPETWIQAHTATGLADARQAWTQALSGERPYEIECELKARDGSCRWHLARALPVRENGEIREWIGTYTDIHDRRGFEQKLRESEMRFRNLCETVPAMIWMSDADGNDIYWNPQWYEFTGVSGEQAIPQNWWDAVHPDDAARVRHVSEQSLNDRSAFVTEYRIKRKDGQYRWCVDTASPHYGLDGKFLGHIGSVMDISERKHIEDATASERSILGLITTGAPLSIVLEVIALSVEARGERSLYCSVMLADADQRQLKFTAAPSLPHDWGAHFDGMTISPEGPPCARSAHSGRQIICQDIADAPESDDYRATMQAIGIAACCVTPILGGNGVVLGTLSMYYDRPHLPSLREQAMARSASHLAGIVIERTRVDAQLKQSLQAETVARGQAEHASRVKDEFLATLSHELRTPLNAILGWSRLMLSESSDPGNISKGLAIIERSARAQTQIIDDLLDMSAILSGKIRLQPEYFDIAGLLRSTLELMQPAALAKQIDLSFESGDPPSRSFFGDTGRLQQVLTNLIGNALKFTPAQGHIQVKVQAETEHLRIAVCDSGIGISPKFLPHIFDRFRQADAGTTRRVGGLGLGLSISRQLVDLHGGTLEAASEGPNCGSTFTIVLPIQNNPIPTQVAGPELQRAEPLSSLRKRLHRLHILLIDDDRDSRDAVEHFLADAGASVICADSADAAEAQLATQAFDVMVSDIAMPQRDGYQLIRNVRTGIKGLPKDIPSIALSAYVRQEDRDQAMQAGFDAHMGKPLDPLGLVELIETLTLAGRRATR